MKSILVVDDEQSIRESLEGILQDEGFRSVIAENGERALLLIKEENIDLVMLDIWMPGIDGIDTLKEIKKTYPTTPVIMIITAISSRNAH